MLMMVELPNYLECIPESVRVRGVGKILLDIVRKKNLNLKSLSDKLNTNYRTFVRYFTESRPIPLGLLKKFLVIVSCNEKEYYYYINKVFLENTGFKGESSNSNPVKLPTCFSNELCYLIGALHDGTVFSNAKKNQYLVQFWQFNDENWLSEIANMFNKVFGVKPKIYSNYIQVCGLPVFAFFRNVIGVPRMQSSWNSFSKIPISSRFYKSVLAGFFDTEGWIGSSWDTRIKFSQNNADKLVEVKRMLLSLGIKTGNVTCERDSRALYISSHTDFVRFCEIFSDFSLHGIKRLKLNNCLRELRS